MAKTNLLKEAIADAKAVRETALANAKIALEEAFTPRIQSMLSAKLAEEEEAEDTNVTETDDAVETNGDGLDAAAGAPVDEAEHGEDEMAEGEHGEEEVAEDMEGEEEVAEDMEGEEDDLELEAILKELEDEESVEEDLDSSDIGSADNKVDDEASSTDDPGEGDLTETEEEKVEETEDKDASLEEIIKALQEEEGDDKVEETEDKEEVSEAEEAEKDLEEAYTVIKFLRSKINEVNLLNAKLLFSNKLFRNHSLNEGQKMKVIENFDRAQSLREVKLVFATLSESFNINGRKTKRSIKESYASKASRSTAPSKKVISEGSDLSARWKKLANL